MKKIFTGDIVAGSLLITESRKIAETGYPLRSCYDIE